MCQKLWYDKFNRLCFKSFKSYGDVIRILVIEGHQIVANKQNVTQISKLLTRHQSGNTKTDI